MSRTSQPRLRTASIAVLSAMALAVMAGCSSNSAAPTGSSSVSSSPSAPGSATSSAGVTGTTGAGTSSGAAGSSAAAGTGGSAGTSGSGTGSAASSAPGSSAAAQAASALVPADIKQKGVLTLATDAEYPPCEYYEAGTTNMLGFEPEIWNAIGDRLGVKVQVSSIQFANLIPGVQGGKYDVAMECITDRQAREDQVTFVDFVYAQVGVIVPAANQHNITEDPLTLCGLNSGAVTGSDNRTRITQFSDYCTAHGKAAVTPVEFPAQGQVLLALRSGRVDFTTQDMAAAQYVSKQSNFPVKAIPNQLIPKVYLGIAINKSNDQLQQAILAALQEIIADGTYGKILAKWDIQQLALNDPGINLATTRPIK